LVWQWLEHVKSFGLPAGLASHFPEDLLMPTQKVG
jgi:hypothetical protein